MTMRPIRTRVCGGVVIFLVSILFAASAQATVGDYADVWADVDWSSLQVSLDSGMSMTVYSDTYSGSYSYADNSDWEQGEQIHELSGFVDTGAIINLSNAKSTANTDSSLLTSTAYATQSAGGSGAEGAYADSSSWRDGEFGISGDGYVQFEIGYELEVDLSASGAEEASGISLAHLFLSNDSTVDEHYEEDFLEYTISNSAGGLLDNVSGTLTVSVYFNDGDFGYFYAGTDCGAEVIPEPCTVLLFGLGGVLVGKRSNK
jgi:hypothetical protein